MYHSEAIAEAEKRASRFVPNQLDRDGYPRVGAVLVMDDQIMGRGFNESGRLLHAESYAIISALEKIVWQDAYMSFIRKLVCQKKLEQAKQLSKFHSTRVTYGDILPDVLMLLQQVDADLQHPLRSSGTVLYVTLAPCNKCQRLLGQLGIPCIYAAHEALRESHAFDAELYYGEYHEGFMRAESEPLIREYRRSIANHMQSIIQKRAKDSMYLSKLGESQMHKLELQKLLWAFDPTGVQADHYQCLSLRISTRKGKERVVWEDKKAMLFLSKDPAVPYIDVSSTDGRLNIVWRISQSLRVLIDDALDRINAALLLPAHEQYAALASVRQQDVLRGIVADYVSAYYVATQESEIFSYRERLHRFIHAIGNMDILNVSVEDYEGVIASFFVRYFLDADIADVLAAGPEKMRLVVRDIVEELDLLYPTIDPAIRSRVSALRYAQAPYGMGEEEELHVMVAINTQVFIFAVAHSVETVWHKGDTKETIQHSLVVQPYSVTGYDDEYEEMPDTFSDMLDEMARHYFFSAA